MESRRSFIKKTVVATSAISMVGVPVITTPACFSGNKAISAAAFKTRTPKKALVVWLSQTGMTRRIGMVMSDYLEKNGIRTISGDIRTTAVDSIEDIDLIIIGGPVFYYDIPDVLKRWIETLPDLDSVPVAAYVTFGGPEGNQHNAACSVLDGITAKKGVPAGMETFMNLSSFPLAWSADSCSPKTWNSRHLPNEASFEKARTFVSHLLADISKGTAIQHDRKITLREISTFFGPIWWTKLLIKNHRIDTETCIDCGTCMALCPESAIDLSDHSINTKACSLCFGCINNCPENAIQMKYSGESVIGFNQFLEMHQLVVKEPEI